MRLHCMSRLIAITCASAAAEASWLLRRRPGPSWPAWPSRPSRSGHLPMQVRETSASFFSTRARSTHPWSAQRCRPRSSSSGCPTSARSHRVRRTQKSGDPRKKRKKGRKRPSVARRPSATVAAPHNASREHGAARGSAGACGTGCGEKGGRGVGRRRGGVLPQHALTACHPCGQAAPRARTPTPTTYPLLLVGGLSGGGSIVGLGHGLRWAAGHPPRKIGKNADSVGLKQNSTLHLEASSPP